MSNNKDFKVKNSIQPTVYQEGLGTVVSATEDYSLAGASYDSVSFSVTGQDNNPHCVLFNGDGTKMYAMGVTTDTIYQYTLSTAYDISTASYDSVSFSVASQTTGPVGLSFNNTGSKVYVVGSEAVFQYTMSTAYDLSTTSYDSVSFSTSSQTTSPSDVVFNGTGSKMYITDLGVANVLQYSLSTVYDVSTASYDSVSFSVSSEDANPRGLEFNGSGTRLLIVGSVTDSVYQYTLSTAYDITTASYDSISLDVSSQDATPLGLTFNTNGTKMYIIGTSSDSIYQYSTALNTASLDLSTGSVFEITPTSDIEVQLSNPASSGTSSGATLLLDGGVAASYDIANAAYDSKSFDVGSQDTTPIGIHISTDGTKMFIIGNATDTVYEYNLSTPYDMSSASYNSVSLSVTSQASSPKGITFKSDGTKMYVLNTADAYQYALSTAWDLSTASYESKTLTISGQSSNARGIQLSNDGTSLFVGSIASTDGVFQYTLSTAFDISTGSYASKFLNVISQASEMSDFDFNSDGTKVFVVDYDDNDVHQYSLSTAFDISTATYDSIVFNPSEGGASSCRGMTFADSGNKLYQLINTGTEVYQYSTTTPATITYPSTLEWPSGTAPTSPAIGDTDVITFNTIDGGTTYKSVLAIDGAS